MISFFFFFIGIIVYLYSAKYLFFYYITWIVLFPFLSVLLIPTADWNAISGMANYFLLFIYVFDVIKTGNKHSAIQVCIMFLLGFYFIFASLLHDIPMMYYIKHYVSVFMPLFLMYPFVRRINEFSKNTIIKYLLFLLLLEIVVCLCQMHLSLFAIAPRSDSAFKYNMSLTNGTLNGNNLLASFVTFLTLCVLILSKRIDKCKIYLLLMLVLYIILHSGIRTYLICFMFFVPVIIYMKTKYKKLLAIILLVVPFILYTMYNNLGNIMGYTTKDASNSLERQLYGISDTFLASNIEESTMSLSWFLWYYFKEHPFWGCGQYFKSIGYGNIISFDTDNLTDATLMFHLAEFGLIGFLLMVIFFYKLSNICYTNFRQILIILYLILISITDIGIFSSLNQALLMLMIFSSQNNNEKELTS